MTKSPFEKILQPKQQAFYQNPLHELVERFPECIDWTGMYIAVNGEYMLRQPSGKHIKNRTDDSNGADPDETAAYREEVPVVLILKNVVDKHASGVFITLTE